MTIGGKEKRPSFKQALIPGAKKAFICYLALVTGCSNTLEATLSPSKAEQSGEREYELPELGGAPEENAISKFFGSSDSVVDVLDGNGFDEADSTHFAAAGVPTDAESQGWSEAEAWAYSKVNGIGNTAIQEWFKNRNATAQLDLGLGRDGLRFGSFDLLAPIVESDQSLFFTQVGFRRANSYSEDYRNTLNVGLGYRHTFDGYLLGGNIFLDRDLTSKNERLGVGAEAWTNNLKLSANAYLRMTGWRESPDKVVYLERPANGWDIRAEAFLPSYPQLSGKLMIEQYLGDDVALFGVNNAMRNPIATTVGLTYTPIPLVSMSADHKIGQGGKTQTSLRLGLNYQLGASLEKQLSTEGIISAKSIASSRYNLVDRNNEIVLDYKAGNNGTLAMPATLRVLPGVATQFAVNTTGPVRNLSWLGTAAPFMHPYNGTQMGVITIPSFDANGVNEYTLQAVAVGGNGLPVTSNEMLISVDALIMQLERSKPEAMADGTDSVLFTARLLQPNSEPEPNSDVVWSVTGPATIVAQDDVTDNEGRARLRLASRKSALVQVLVSSVKGSQANAEADFHGDAATARVGSVTALTPDVVANGVHSTVINARVVDASGNTVGQGVEVAWSTSGGTLSSNTSVTDRAGNAQVQLSGTKIGTETVTATMPQGSAQADVKFISDITTAKPVSNSVTSQSIVANGSDSTTISVVLKDANDNLVGAGVEVAWTTSNGTLSGQTSVTDGNGTATIELTGVKAGNAVVTATSAAGSVTANVTFVPDTTTSQLSTLRPANETIIANGVDATTIEGFVTDANGNNVGAGITITWSADHGQVSPTSSVTDSDGKVSVEYKGTKSGVANISGVGSGGSFSAAVTLKPDHTTARVDSQTATPVNLVADGVTPSTLEASVVDAYGNPVGAGVTVNWSATTGVLGGTTSQTNESGKATMTITGTTTAAVTVTASSVFGNSTQVINFVPDSSTARVVGLTSTEQEVTADGVQSTTYSAVIEDAKGNRAGAGVAINWETTIGDLAGATSLTDANGVAKMVLTGTKSGEATITASGVAGGMTGNTVFLPNPASAKAANLSLSKPSITADGQDATTITALILDAYGNALGAGIPVTWASSNGQLSSLNSVTDSDGLVSVTFNGTKSGLTTVTALAAGGQVTTAITVIADNSTGRVVAQSANPSSIAANGREETTLTAEVHDAFGNPVGEGVTVNWAATSGQLGGQTSVTDASGKATMTFTGEIVELVTITANAGVGTVTADVQLTPDYGTARIVQLTKSTDTIVSSGLDQSTINVVLEDAKGNRLWAGATVNWSTTLGQVASSATQTDANGVASVVFTSTKMGTANITATAAVGSEDTVVTITPDVASAIAGSFTESAKVITANGVENSTIGAVITDSNGNNVGGGITVSWSSDIATVAPRTAVTDENGYVETVVSGTKSGVATVTATSAGGASSTNLTMEPDNTTARVVSQAASPAAIVANGIDQTTLTALVADAYGNPVTAGVPVTWSATSAELEGATSFTDSSGLAVMRLKGTKRESVIVTAETPLGSSNATARLMADASTARVVSMQSSASSIPGNNSTGSVLTATIVDAYDNPMEEGVSVAWQTTAGSLASQSTTTDSQGRAKNTLTGTSVATAQVSAISPQGSADAVVDVVVDLASAQVSTIERSVASIVANGSTTATMTATVTDVSGNPVGAGITVNWASTIAQVSSVTSVTDAQSKTSITVKGTKAGVATVTARGLVGSKSVNVTLAANTATSRPTELAASKAELIANGTDSLLITAVIKDANGNIVGAGVPVTWSTTGGTLNTTSGTTDANGRVNVTFSAGLTPGVFTVTSSSQGGSSSVAITVKNGSPTFNSIAPSAPQYYWGGCGVILVAPQVSWSIAGVDENTEYTISARNTSDRNSPMQVFKVAKNISTVYFVNGYNGTGRFREQDMFLLALGTIQVEVKACNGSACTTAATQYRYEAWDMCGGGGN